MSTFISDTKHLTQLLTNFNWLARTRHTRAHSLQQENCVDTQLKNTWTDFFSQYTVLYFLLKSEISRSRHTRTHIKMSLYVLTDLTAGSKEEPEDSAVTVGTTPSKIHSSETTESTIFLSFINVNHTYLELVHHFALKAWKMTFWMGGCVTVIQWVLMCNVACNR